MGQIFGTPEPQPDFIRFVNLSREAIESLWMSFNLYGEGWGLDIDQLKEIFAGATYLKESIGFTDEEIEKLFACFDSDGNQLVDSLEILIVLALSSGMDTVDKLLFCYGIYDFDKSGELSKDEVSLLIRTAVYGLNKVCKIQLPEGEDLEKTTDLIFLDADRSNDMKLSVYEFQTYCCLHPVVSSWMRYYSSLVTAFATPEIGMEDPDVVNMTFTLPLTKGLSNPGYGEEKGAAADAAANNTCGSEDVPAWHALADTMIPEEAPPIRPDPPEDGMEPVWLHGQRCFDSRGAVRYGKAGNILFMTSAIGVNMSKDSESGMWSQKFLFDHDAPVTCLVVDSSKTKVASADRVDGVLGGNQREARIIVWDSNTNAQKCTIPVSGCRGIRYLDFSPDGNFIIALTTDEHNFLMMYDLRTSSLAYSCYLGPAKIMDIKFTNTDSLFAVAGAEGIDFFAEEGGSFMASNGMRLYEKRSGLFQSVGREAEGVVISCLSAFERADEMVSGNVKGHVLFWRGRNCLQLVKAHEGAVTCMHFNHTSKRLVSGGRDGKINVYTVCTPPNRSGNAGRRRNSFQQKVNIGRSIEIAVSIDMLSADVICSEVRSVCMWDDGKKVLTGALSGEILELSCVGAASAVSAPEAAEGEEGEKVARVGDDVNGGPVLRSHWDKTKQPAVHGLCKLPAGGFLSCGSDGSVRQWQTGDEVQHKEVRRVVLESGCKSIASSSTNIAVAMDGSIAKDKAGAVKIMAQEDFRTLADLKNASMHMNALSFSPDGNSLACAGSDNMVYVYSMGEDQTWTLKGSCTGHMCEVLHVDFSSDGQFLRSSDADEELIVWDLIINFGGLVTDPETLRPIQWASSTVPLTWDLKGVYGSVRKGERVVCVDRMHHLAVLGLSSGALLLTRIPSHFSDHHRREEAHCGQVSSVCFIDEGARMVTAGSEDGLIQVWKATFDFDELEVSEAAGEGGDEGEDADLDSKDVVYDSGEDEDCMEVADRLMGGPAVLARLRGSMLTAEERANAASGSVADAADGEDSFKPKSAAQIIDIFEKTPFAYDKTKSVEENWINANPWSSAADITATDLAKAAKVPPPNAELRLDWVYGYAGRSTRASARYSKEGDIVYPASTIAVMLNKVKGVQSYAMHHSDEITCLDVHLPTGKAVSAQRTSSGPVFASVWSTEDGNCIRRLNCGSVKGASAVCFSPSGEYIAVACQDMTHSIVVFDWMNNVLKCRVPGGTAKVLGLTFSIASVETTSMVLLQVGIEHFNVLKIKGRQMSSKRGKFGAGVAKQNVLCAAALPLSTPEGNEFIMGMSDGNVAILAKGEKTISSMVPMHPKGVTAICAVKLTDGNLEENCTYKIVTGGVDGFIKVLSQDLEPTAEFNVYKEEYGLYQLGKARGIKSLCVDKAARKILFGTAGGEISEIDINDGKDLNGAALVTSHCRDELHGMITHPMKVEAASVGDDKTLRVWNLERKKMMAMLELPDIARCVCYSPTGQIIAVGLGGHVTGENRMPRKLDGKVVIVSYMQGSLRIVHEIYDSKKPISALAFSADGSELFVGSEDCNVYAYNIHEDFRQTFVFSGHVAGITGIDLSEDGKIMATADLLNTVVYWNLENEDIRGEQFSPSDAKKKIAKTTWFTRQNVLGVDSVGVQKLPFAMGDILCLSQSRDKTLLATGDCKGGLSIFHSPCGKPCAPYAELFGHSPGGIARIAFSSKDKYILSIGKYDRCVFQWQLEKHDIQEDVNLELRPTTAMSKFEKLGSQRAVEEMVEVSPLSWDEDSMVINGVNFARESNPALPPVRASSLAALGMSCASFSKQTTFLPQAFYCGSGDIVTAAGSIPVAICSNRNSQGHWNLPRNKYGFCDDIGVICVSSDGRSVAVCEKPPAAMHTDQASENFWGRQFVYDGSTGILLSELPGHILGGVISAAFSSDGYNLACLGCDAQHSLTIFNSVEGSWKDPIRVFCGQVDLNPVSIVTSVLTSKTNSEFQFATGGRGRLRFWKLRGRNVVSSACEAVGSMAAITAMVSVEAGQLITGDAAGNISMWDGKACIETSEGAHGNRVSALCRYGARPTSGPGFISASSDTIKVWNMSMEVVQEIPLVEILFRINRVVDSTYVHSICVDSVFKRLLVTTSTSLILEVSIDSGAVLLVNEGHTSGSFVAITAHPIEPRILITGGYDGWLKCWDIRSQAALEVMNMGEPISCLVCREDGQSFVMAMGDTIVVMAFDVYSSRKFSVVSKVSKVGKGKVPMMRFSPDESILAVGSSDGNIYILDVENKYSQISNLKGHSRAVDGLDFSKTGKYLRSFSRNAENESVVKTLFHVVEKGSMSTYELVDEPDTLTGLAKAEWVSVSSPAAPEGRGMRTTPDQRAASDFAVIVTSTTVSKDGSLLAVGYSDGNVKLFRNPACSADALGIDLVGHAKGGVACSFSADGIYLYTAGAMDGTVVIWNLEREVPAQNSPSKRHKLGRLNSFDF